MSAVMLDIETASSNPNNAVILSIGLVEFTVDRPEGPYIGDHRLLIPAVRPQLAAARQVDADTMTWWLAQSTEAAEHWVNGEESAIPDVLVAITNFVGSRKVWAHGVCFDIGNLESLYRQWHMAAPWKYNDVRDSRTVTREFPKFRRTPDGAFDGLDAHNPIGDCTMQIWGLWECWPDVGPVNTRLTV